MLHTKLLKWAATCDSWRTFIAVIAHELNLFTIALTISNATWFLLLRLNQNLASVWPNDINYVDETLVRS